MGHVWLSIQSWLWEKAFDTVDTWVPVTTLHGSHLGSVHLEFQGHQHGRGRKAGAGIPGLPTTTTIVNVTIERATLLTSPLCVFGEVPWSSTLTPS